MAASDIVVVNVSLASGGAQAQGFGIPLILGAAKTTTVFGSDLIRFYSGVDEMVTDGYATTDGEYIAAGKMFEQSPAPASVAIGRRANPPTKTVTITPTAANSTAYALNIQGNDVSVTSDGSATAAEICDALKTAIDALSLSGITTASASGVLTVTGSANKWYQLKVADRARLALKDTTADGGIATDLAAIKVVNDSWYGLMSVFGGALEVTAAATWVASAGKLMVQQTSDTGCVGSGSTDIMSTQQTAGRGRTALIFSNDNADFKDAAWLGAFSPVQPGRENWANRTLSGCSVDTLTSTEQTNLRAKSGNFYADFAGASMTAAGTCADGGFIDIVRGKDWFGNQISVATINLLNRLSNLGEKLPYDDDGTLAIRAELEALNERAASKTIGFLDPKRPGQISMPAFSSISDADKEARVLNGVTNAVFLSNAINKVVYQVNLSF